MFERGKEETTTALSVGTGLLEDIFQLPQSLVFKSLMKIRGIVLYALRLNIITWLFPAWREVGTAFPCAKYPAFLQGNHTPVFTLEQYKDGFGTCCWEQLRIRDAVSSIDFGFTSPRLKCVKWRGQRGWKAAWNVSGYHTGCRNVNWKQMPAFSIVHSQGKRPCGFRSLGLRVFILNFLGNCWSVMCSCSWGGRRETCNKWWILGSARGQQGLWIVVKMRSCSQVQQAKKCFSTLLRWPEMGQESSGRDTVRFELLQLEQGRSSAWL